MEDLFPDVTGAVLVGGRGLRMGSDKALLRVGGRPLYRIALDALAAITPRLLLVGGPAERFAGEPVPVAEDLYPGSSLGGIHAAIHASATPWVFVLACDMPSPDPALIRGLLSLRGGHDLVVPRRQGRFEPLCAAYSRACLPAMERLLQEGGRRIADLFPLARTRLVDMEGEGGEAFANLNTPEEYRALAGGGEEKG